MTELANQAPPAIPPRTSTPGHAKPAAERHNPCRALPTLAALLFTASAAHAQLSLATTVDLGLRNNPRIKMAQADIARARAQLAETHDVYIPSLSAGAGIGYAYGYSPYPPTLFTFNGGSLLYNPAQIFYIRSARAGVDTAQHSYEEARDAVSQDIALAYLALQHNEQRLSAITEQTTFGSSLVSIVQARLDSGQASAIDLTQAKLTAANLHLALLHAQDDVAAERDHLARLVGVAPSSVIIDKEFPATPQIDATAGGEFSSPAVASAFSNALARREQATGDAKFRFRPLVNLAVQYNRYATFTESFHTLNGQYGGKLTANEYVVGLQITLPLYDRYREAKARETAADASHALHEAENAKLNALDAQERLRHSLPEIQARAEVASLQQQLAQQQLEVLRVQLQSGNPNGPQMTPADEQNAGIAERDKYLNVIDADFQLRTTQLQLLRLTGRLSAWLKDALLQPTPAPPAPASPPSAATTPLPSAPPLQ